MAQVMREACGGTILMPTDKDKTIPEPGDLQDAGIEDESA
jgi:hypothetical protein